MVRLKSGGPEMTVIAISKRGACLCGWFTCDDVFHEQWMASAVLVEVAK